MTKIIIPKSVQVGGHTYSIKFADEMRDEGDWGRVHHRRQVIEINPARPESQKFEALIHEILHLVNNVYLDSKLDEAELDSISEGMTQALISLGIKFNWKEIENAKSA